MGGEVAGVVVEPGPGTVVKVLSRLSARRHPTWMPNRVPRRLAPGDSYKILFVCSSGGHLSHLLRLRSWWEQRERIWVTFDKPDAVGTLADERVVWGHHPVTAEHPQLASEPAPCDPDLVDRTTGRRLLERRGNRPAVHLARPLARLSHCVHRSVRSGRYPHAQRAAVPSGYRIVPRSAPTDRRLVPGVRGRRTRVLSDISMTTMPLIVVTVGTDHHPFDRLIGWIDELAANRGQQAEIVVQCGCSRRAGRSHDRGDGTRIVRHIPRLDEARRRRGDARTEHHHGGRDARHPGHLVPTIPSGASMSTITRSSLPDTQAEEGLFTVVNDRAELFEMLDAAIADPQIYHFDPSTVPLPLPSPVSGRWSTRSSGANR